MIGKCPLSLVPLRLEPSDRSEMVSQLLFGESYQVIDELKGWLLVKVIHDGYEGWMDKKQSLAFEFNLAVNDEPETVHVVAEIMAPAFRIGSESMVALCKGSVLPQFRKNKFSLGGHEFIFESEAREIPASPQPGNILKTAMEYLNTPYLWGGRSPFGIDCSGFTQMVFRLCGIPLKRDATQQFQEGEMISFINEAQPGDLAFFENAVGNITHTGILTGTGKIIHASGCVRIDSIDHHGIYNSETGQYTHTLRLIKRMI